MIIPLPPQLQPLLCLLPPPPLSILKTRERRKSLQPPLTTLLLHPRERNVALRIAPPPLATAAVGDCDAEGGEEEREEISLSLLLLPNALRRRRDPNWRGGFSLGIDLGGSRTGLALGKGFSPPRPLSVVELRGQKLESHLLEVAQRQEADEFIVGLPKSGDGTETRQSNKVRSIVGRLAVSAAERGWRVYLQDEHGTSLEALGLMIDIGLKKSARQGRIDAYSAVMVLERYFSRSGHGIELVLPKKLELQDRLRKSVFQDMDFLLEEN